jgi:hypothetical protein
VSGHGPLLIAWNLQPAVVASGDAAAAVPCKSRVHACYQNHDCFRLVGRLNVGQSNLHSPLDCVENKYIVVLGQPFLFLSALDVVSSFQTIQHACLTVGSPSGVSAGCLAVVNPSLDPCKTSQPCCGLVPERERPLGNRETEVMVVDVLCCAVLDWQDPARLAKGRSCKEPMQLSRENEVKESSNRL